MGCSGELLGLGWVALAQPVVGKKRDEGRPIGVGRTRFDCGCTAGSRLGVWDLIAEFSILSVDVRSGGLGGVPVGC